MRVVASSSILHEKTQSTQVCSFLLDIFIFTFSSPSGLCGSTLKWKQSGARPRSSRVRDVARSVSLMSRLNLKSSVFKMWMLYFQGSPFQIIVYVMVICISASKQMRVIFFQNKLFVTLSGQPKNKNNNNLSLLHSVKTLHGHSGSN